MINNIFAKSKENGKIKLVEHSIAVINVSVYLFNQIIKEKINFNDFRKENIKKFNQELILTAALHDIGKCSKEFQKNLNKSELTDDGNYMLPKTKKNSSHFIPHNISGWAYLYYYCKNISDIIKNNILYHHTVDPTFRKMTVLDIISDEDMVNSKDTYDEFYKYMIRYCNDTYGLDCNIDITEAYDDEKTVDGVSLYRQVKANDSSFYSLMDNASKYLIIRSIIVFADRFVSTHYNKIDLMCNDDNSFFEEEISDKIINSSKKWIDNVNELKDEFGNSVYDSERLVEQNRLLKDIGKHSNNIVSASAGFGKTLVGLRWILRNNKKALWVVPRNVIAEGTYRSVCSERDKMGYTEDDISIGLLITGQWKHGSIDSDIIITNIDNFLSMMIRNNMAGHLIKEIGCNIIFDEYHEFLCRQELFAGFIEFVYTRCKFTHSKTLLLSATPLRFDEAYFNDEDININFLKAKAYNGQMKVRINFLNMANMNYLSIKEQDSFVICNTVGQSQELFKRLGKGNDILIHSKFPTSRRLEIENKIYEYHGKDSIVAERNNIFGTNIIGVGLDISAMNIYDFVITPENTIQRVCGRGGRFGEKEYNNEINYVICNLNNNRSNSHLINELISNSLHTKWLKILESIDGSTVTKDDLYELYYNFYNENKNEATKLWSSFLDESSRKLMSLRPYKTFTKSKDDTNNKLSDKQSYRGVGNSIYVVTHMVDGTYSMPMIVNRNYICDDEFIGKAFKNKEKYFKDCIESKDNKNKLNKKKKIFVDRDEMFRQALNLDTPLLLEYSTYDDIYGLSLNALSKKQDTYEEEID